jgi:hypothetical protein
LDDDFIGFLEFFFAGFSLKLLGVVNLGLTKKEFFNSLTNI